ncbi:MAG TPA: FHA domain-containing protein [Gemmataceae bacterium]|nr:FHA domain-containing protein [Gemmataceae bacterium]
MPAPMLEPVLTPVTAADSRPLADVPVLTLPMGRPDSPPADAPREASAVPNIVLEAPPRRDKAPGETNPALPALHDHPMNSPSADAVADKPDLVEQTIPATAPADRNPIAPPPAPPLRPRLVVLRGQKINAEFPVYEGRNTIGRFADKPVDIDLISQESDAQIWCSRQHAAITFDNGAVLIEDLNSLNGTWVNGVRIHPGQLRVLKANDIIQVGTVQMKLVLE